MDTTRFDYSLKNIPIQPKNLYIKELMDKTCNFIKNMRWRALFFDKKEKKEKDRVNHNEPIDQIDATTDDTNATYGFNTDKSPPAHQALSGFENGMFEIINNIQFMPVTNSFQKKLTHDVKTINSCKNLLIPADKTSNIYKLPPEKYKELLHNNITNHYKKADPNLVTEINTEACNIAQKFKLEGRMECLAPKEAFITIKDHKPNFPNKIECRLLNPTKSEMGKISSKELQKLNHNIRRRTQLNQWRSTPEVLTWFNTIPNKENSSFIQIDIDDFYASISEDLLIKSLNFASEFEALELETLEAIYNSRKSLLFNNNEAWVKKDGTFDVTMGSFDGAEVCELVGLYLLHKLPDVTEEKLNAGAYRDDWLIVHENIPGPTLTKIKKDIEALFKLHGLHITYSGTARTHCVNFLDATLNLKTGTHSPFRKPNDHPKYIHIHSNHPPNIINEIPNMIENRLSYLSSNQTIFENSKSEYEKALKDSGHKKHTITFQPTKNRKKKTRSRKITWFNPPYNQSVKTNIGQLFFKLLAQHFPPNTKYHKIFNKNTVKLSYSCSNNMKTIITNHNKKVLNNPKKNNNNNCNCTNPSTCPLDGKCQTPTVVYKATVTCDNVNKEYVGATEGKFKTRYANHKTSLTHEKYKSSTTLSQYYWTQKDDNKQPTIKFEILQQTRPYLPGTRKCSLCTAERQHILAHNKNNPAHCLNSRSELTTTCRHRSKWKLKNAGKLSYWPV